MVDEHLIRERLRLLVEYIEDLQDVQGVSLAEFQENKVLRRFIERTLQLAIEACLDIGSHIIAAEGYREPQYNRDVVEILSEHGWLSQDVKNNLVGMVGFRNILVHDYAAIDPVIVFGVLERRLEDLESFARAILTRLEAETRADA